MSDFSEVIFDIETNGLLPSHMEPPFCMDRIHSLWIRDAETGETMDFANNDHGDDLVDGLWALMDADKIIGHNIIDFDIRALQLIYPKFDPTAILYDTLVMSRMVFANVKDTDFRLAAKGMLPGRMIGMQGLESWGYRLGLNKGDYVKEREAELKEFHKENGLDAPTKEEHHFNTWGTWSPEMHDYCSLDTEVNWLLYNKLQEFNWSPQAVNLEHNIHSLMVQQETNGFFFDVEKAEKLADSIRVEYDHLTEEAITEIGNWYRPARVITDEVDQSKGESNSRRTWGEVTYPKRSMSYSKSNGKMMEAGTLDKLRGDTTLDAPFVKVICKEFNPNSRQQIVDRLKTLHGWEPQDFTEKGSPKVDDEVLRVLADTLPIADTLAEIFFMKKKLGQVADGKNGWLKLVRPDGRIHGRVNVGGAVSGRATHASPNISQVPGVSPVEFKDEEKGLLFLEDHKDEIISSKWNPTKGEWKIITRGRTGKFGWDSRELFTVEPGFKLVGSDLSGVEFRCLANFTYPYDDGELIETVLTGDIHQQNADLAGITRGVAKTLLYALMYGAGDAKLGSTVEPLSSENRQKTVGKGLRAKLMAAMPSLNKALKAIKKEMRQNSGTVAGLDGRRLYARSPHSVLNLRLQSDGALIAKKWCLLIDDMMYQEGWDHGVGKEYAFNSWSHDEVQVTMLDGLEDRAAEIMEAAAPLAGEYFGIKCPIAAESVVGMNWAQTH